MDVINTFLFVIPYTCDGIYMGFKSCSEYFPWDLNTAVSIFSVSKVCGGRGHPCRNIL